MTEFRSSSLQSSTVNEKDRAVAELITTLRSWCEGDEADAKEQAESFEQLAKGIDERRRPYRTLFDGDRA